MLRAKRHSQHTHIDAFSHTQPKSGSMSLIVISFISEWIYMNIYYTCFQSDDKLWFKKSYLEVVVADHRLSDPQALHGSHQVLIVDKPFDRNVQLMVNGLDKKNIFITVEEAILFMCIKATLKKDLTWSGNPPWHLCPPLCGWKLEDRLPPMQFVRERNPKTKRKLFHGREEFWMNTWVYILKVRIVFVKDALSSLSVAVTSSSSLSSMWISKRQLVRNIALKSADPWEMI